MTAPDLRALAEAAPRGPWSFWVSKGNGDRYVLTKDGTAMAMMVRGSNTNPEPVGRYLTAVSPDVILALLDEIDALRDVIETALQNTLTAVVRQTNTGSGREPRGRAIDGAPFDDDCDPDAIPAPLGGAA